MCTYVYMYIYIYVYVYIYIYISVAVLVHQLKMNQNHKVLLIPVSYLDTDSFRHIHVKASVYHDDAIFCDLRRLLSALFPGRQLLRISELLKRELQPWHRFLETVGLDPAECVHPSRRYASAHGEDCASDPTAVYHSAVPWLLAHQMSHSQSRKQKQIATSLFTGLLRELLSW